MSGPVYDYYSVSMKIHTVHSSAVNMDISSVILWCYFVLGYVVVKCGDIQATVGSSNLNLVDGGNNTNSSRTGKKRMEMSEREMLSKILNEPKTQNVSILNYRLHDWARFLKNKELYKTKTLSSKLRKLDPKPFKIDTEEIILKRELIDCLYAHNYLRRLHNLDELLWHGDLAYRAEHWAMVLAARDKDLTHSPNPDNNGLYFGENAYVGYSIVRNCVDAVDLWYSEINRYNYSDWTQGWYTAGHFLQIVWPTAKYVGVGLAYAQNDNTYIVAQYMTGVSSMAKPVPKPTGPANEEDMYFDPKPPQPDVPFSVPLDGGWTSWESITPCSVTCGKGKLFQNRYCIDLNAASAEQLNACGGGEKQRTVECILEDCPLNPVGECNDISKDCEADSQEKAHCMDENYWESMKKTCKKTCNFCRPCKDLKVDCPAYATSPYNYCTDARYRDWMLVDCAKSCGYCEQNVTTVYDTDCINYHPDCDDYAKNLNYCMDEKYGPWMSVYCKQSCDFCKKCEDINKYCDTLAASYGYCTYKYEDLMLNYCSKSCNYCFQPPT